MDTNQMKLDTTSKALDVVSTLLLGSTSPCLPTGVGLYLSTPCQCVVSRLVCKGKGGKDPHRRI